MWSIRSSNSLPALAAILLAALTAACGFKSPGNGPDAGIDPDAPDSDADAGADASIDAAPAAWLPGWTHRKQITLRASQIEAPGNGALTDFPVLVSVTDAQIGATALASGTDIVFTEADGTARLASEIESFTKGNSQLVAWVKVPTLSATVDTTLYVYYGNATPPARTPEETWTASYLGVWHLNQDPAAAAMGNVLDSTTGNHDFTSRNMQSNDLTAGQIGLGFAFNGSNEFVDVPQLSTGSTFTISMWVEFGGGNDPRTLLANSGPAGDADGFRFFINTPGTTDRRLIFETGNGNAGSARIARTGTNEIPNNALAHVAAVVNRPMGTALLYVNGASVATETAAATMFATNTLVSAARMTDASSYLAGKLDEIEIATTARPAEWLKTSFNNQSQPSSFHALGPEEQAP